VMLPDQSGFEVLEVIAERAPQVSGLLISGRDQVAMRQRARSSSARGFISKTAPPAQIVANLEHVLAGGTVFEDSPASATVPVLTTRQAEILILLAEGHGNKEIRYRLGIAERTVRAHLTELFNILGVHGRMPAVIRARDLGLIE
jgi:DNA-binding NarL/FixJ family response regulator